MNVNATFRTVFGWYVRRRIQRGLDGLWVRGLDHAARALAAGPVVLAATHVAWWDGMLLAPLDDALGRTGRVWMEAENLRRLPFLGALGFLPVDGSSNAALRQSIREASAWLTAPRRALWVFPQGRQRPPWLRPLGLEPGAAWLARRTGAALLPVALAYGFREAPVPAAVVSIGEAVEPDARALEAALVEELTATDRFLDSGDARLVVGGHPPGFTALVGSTARGAQHGLGARMLAAVTRGR